MMRGRENIWSGMRIVDLGIIRVEVSRNINIE